jgi:hypothetical protein
MPATRGLAWPELTVKVPETELYRLVAAGGLEPKVLQADRGGLLVTVHGARVLGIFLGGSAENLLWVHPELGDAERARRFVAGGQWNLGGDRCWLSPELELHFRDPRRPSHEDYAVPPAIDPGQYVVQRESQTGLVLESGGQVGNLLTGRPFRFATTRAIHLCPPPLDIGDLSYVGYSLSSELRVIEPDRPEACYGLWQLMQIPPGGTVYVPVRGQPEIVDYFQTGVSSHCRVSPTQVVFPVTGNAKHKLGLRSADVTGMMGCYRPGPSGSATLIVRQAAVFAGATYADYPAHQPERRDVALQFYNDSGQIGGCPIPYRRPQAGNRGGGLTPRNAPSGFGEMEYHSVAACGDNSFQVRDLSCTWCFAGPAAGVAEVGRQLLGLAESG